MFLGLGLPEWLTIIGLVGGLFLTFYLMAKGSVAYERARAAKEAAAQGQADRTTGESDEARDPSGVR